jgi:two-component system copper resistance phosphate regulon response regulator CusR
MQILVVEDNVYLSRVTKQRLERHGFVVTIVYDGAMALKMLSLEDFDLIILDLSLPDQSGLKVLDIIRQKKNTTPVIVMTASFEIGIKLDAFAFGADDYVVKPVNFSELLSRMRAILKRTGKDVLSTQKMRYNKSDLSINFHRREVTRAGKSIQLRNREYHLLLFFVQHEGMVLTKEDIKRELWPNNKRTTDGNIRVQVRWLREKLDKEQTEKFIHTIPGVGYLFELRAIPTDR